MIPDSQTVSEIKHVAAKTAGKMALASIKLRRPGFRKPQRFDFKHYNNKKSNQLKFKFIQKMTFKMCIISVHWLNMLKQVNLQVHPNNYLQ